MRLTVNGREHQVPPGTLEALLLHLGIESKAVVAEVNGAIIAPEDFSGTPLHNGDSIELVRFVGGG